jgi:hypothetical protein
LSCSLITRFTAYWPQGPIRGWDKTANDWERGWQQANSDVIILKRIKSSNNMTSDFLKEVRNLTIFGLFSSIIL